MGRVKKLLSGQRALCIAADGECDAFSFTLTADSTFASLTGLLTGSWATANSGLGADAAGGIGLDCTRAALTGGIGFAKDAALLGFAGSDATGAKTKGALAARANGFDSTSTTVLAGDAMCVGADFPRPDNPQNIAAAKARAMPAHSNGGTQAADLELPERSALSLRGLLRERSARGTTMLA